MSHRRHCLNITKKERIFRKAFNRNRWSQVPPKRIRRIINLLTDVERCQINNATYDRLINQGEFSPGFERQLYPSLEYTSSEYESDSADDEYVSSNESTKSQHFSHSPDDDVKEEPKQTSSIRVLSNSPISGKTLSNSPIGSTRQTKRSRDNSPGSPRASTSKKRTDDLCTSKSRADELCTSKADADDLCISSSSDSESINELYARKSK